MVLAPVNLTNLIQQIGELYASRAEQKDVQFTLNLPSEDVMTQGDESLLARAIENLLDNALKFTPVGGTVTVMLSETAQIAINDTGIGINKEDCDHIFERFYRGRNAMRYPGNGIGLMLIRTIIEQHNGTIRFESGEGSTTFFIQLSLEETP